MSCGSRWSRLTCPKIEWVQSPYSSLPGHYSTSSFRNEARECYRDLNYSFKSSAAWWGMGRIGAGCGHLFHLHALCLLGPTPLNVCTKGWVVCSILMLGFWFISSSGSELVTLIWYQVKIKPYSLQDFCLVVQQLFLSAQWALFGAAGPWLQCWLLGCSFSFLRPTILTPYLIPIRSWSREEKGACLYFQLSKENAF